MGLANALWLFILISAITVRVISVFITLLYEDDFYYYLFDGFFTAEGFNV